MSKTKPAGGGDTAFEDKVVVSLVNVAEESALKNKADFTQTKRQHAKLQPPVAHPFLPAPFGKLGLFNDNQVFYTAAQEKAVHLLYYVATKQQLSIESELVFLKMPCGMQPNSFIERKVTLSLIETVETEQTLKALVDHWATIQERTPEELRATLFLREGKLTSMDLSWRLTIEQSSFDELLTKTTMGFVSHQARLGGAHVTGN